MHAMPIIKLMVPPEWIPKTSAIMRPSHWDGCTIPGTQGNGAPGRAGGLRHALQ
jgi:hypothetical protein